MKLAVEPKGIDLVVEPHKYTKSDAELMTKIISNYKETGEFDSYLPLKKHNCYCTLMTTQKQLN